MEQNHRKLSRWPLTVIALLSVLGLLASLELTQIHYLTHTDPGFHAACAVSEEVNCETVALSPFAVFSGIPVSIWGALGYTTIGLLALWGLLPWRLCSRWPVGLLAPITGLALVPTAVLATLSFSFIDSLCLYCMACYALNLALFATAVFDLRRAREQLADSFARDFSALLNRHRLLLVLSAGGALALLIIQVAVPSYWKAAGWSDLPALPRGTDADGHHWIGAKRPTTTVVEFSDYECPHCRRAHKNARQLAAEFPRDVRVIHRHLPLDRACHPGLSRDFHRHACRLAFAAECAAEQERFWEMNDALFAVQDDMPAEDVDVVRLAVQLGLDRSRFKKCLETGLGRERVERDLADAMAQHLNATPTFIIGERHWTGQLPRSALVGALGSRVANSAAMFGPTR